VIAVPKRVRNIVRVPPLRPSVIIKIGQIGRWGTSFLIVVTGEGHRSQTLATGISAIHQYISRYFDSRQDIAYCQNIASYCQSESKPSFRIIPRMASAWPWERVFWVANRSWGETRVCSRNRRRKVSILCGGPCERLAKVRFTRLSAFAATFAEEDGGRGVVIGGHSNGSSKVNTSIYMGAIYRQTFS
jgi:hypothetical protein